MIRITEIRDISGTRDYIISHKYLMSKMNEHLWSGIIHRSETGETRKEDSVDFLDRDELVDYICNNYEFDQSLGHCNIARVDSKGMYLLGYLKKSQIGFFYKYNTSLTLETGYAQIALEPNLFDDLKVEKNLGSHTVDIHILDKENKCSNTLFIDVLNRIIRKYKNDFTLKKI